MMRTRSAMAAHIDHPSRSRRFIKVYLSTWALLAVGALTYLAMLAFPPQAAAPVPQVNLQPAKSVPAGSKGLAEARSMRGSLSEVRKDVAQLQEAVGERVINEKVVQTRLTALEERVSTIDGTQQPSAAPGGLSETSVPGVKVLDTTARTASDPPPAADGPAKTQKSPVPAPTATPAPFVPIETGSIAPKAEIVFGEPTVTPAGQKEFAVQLAAGSSLQALRQSWGQLAERHAGALATLQPRVVAPRSEGGTYRLIAGPVPTKAEAERICGELRVGPKGCFATAYAGVPL